MSKTYSLAEAAEAIGVKPGTLARWIRRFDLPEAIPVTQSGSTVHLFDEAGIEILRGRIAECEINGKKVKFFSDKARRALEREKRSKQLALPLWEKIPPPPAQLPPIAADEVARKIDSALNQGRMKLFLSRMLPADKEAVSHALTHRPDLAPLMGIQLGLADEVNPLALEGALRRSGTLQAVKIGKRVFYDKAQFVSWYLANRQDIKPNSPWLAEPIIDGNLLPAPTKEEIALASRNIPVSSRALFMSALKDGGFTAEMLASRTGAAPSTIRIWAKDVKSNNGMISIGNRFVLYPKPMVLQLVAKINQAKLSHQEAIQKLLNPPAMRPSVPPPPPAPKAELAKPDFDGRKIGEWLIKSLENPDMVEFMRGLAKGILGIKSGKENT